MWHDTGGQYLTGWGLCYLSIVILIVSGAIKKQADMQALAAHRHCPHSLLLVNGLAVVLFFLHLLQVIAINGLWQ
ncbi:hypothetical protein ABC733_21140 [Mangrovibacter sp. SLW1]